MNMRSAWPAATLAAAITLISASTVSARDALTDPTQPPGARGASPARQWSQSAMRVEALPPDSQGQIRYNIQAVDASARAFFEALAQQTPENILVRPEVTGHLSVTIKHVTLEDALESVRDVYGYDYRHTSRGYVISPATLQSRVFHLNYLDLDRKGVSRTRVSSGQITQGGNSSYGGSGAQAVGTDPSISGGTGPTTSDVSGTSVTSQNDSDLWTAVAVDLKAIIGGAPGRSVVINRQSGVILVRAMPSELRDVADYLQQTSDSVSRQVILEAKILEVELSDAYQAGINWAAVFKDGGKQYTIGQASPPGGFDTNLLAPAGSPVTIAPGNPINGFLNKTLGGALTIAADFPDFNALIQLLGVQGKTRVLSSPRVSTLHNQKAIIKAGSDEFFVTHVASNTVVGTSTSTTRDVDLTPFFSGVALDVTPQISGEGDVILHVHPTVSDVTDQIKSLTIAGNTDTLPLALSQIRESDSIVKAHSGQVIVIGGLMRETRNNQNYKTPVLGDVPGLGKLFRSERKQSKTVELVILLRPLVVNNGDWPALVSEPTERIDELARKAKLK
jgi:MSHA biogenesis protein MshL